MGRFYGERIQRKEITLDGVPKLWKTVTEKWLKSNIPENGEEKG